MIETWEQFVDFATANIGSDLLFHAVPLHDGVHPAINWACLLFIRALHSEKTYYIGFDHPDTKKFCLPQQAEAMALFNSMKGTRWAIDQKSFRHMLPINDLYDVGVAQHLRDNKVFEIQEFETTAHSLIRRNFGGRKEFGKFVPLVKHLEMFNELAETCQKIIKQATPISQSFKQFHRFIMDPLGETEKHGLTISPAQFLEHFGMPPDVGRVYTQYNVYTSTGRPSNRFGGINYAALNKEDGSRKAFVSRHGNNGQLVLIDYSGFHPHIVSMLTEYPIDPNVDIYEYLAKLYFNKTEVDESDIADAKQITFRQFFGGVEEKYSHIKYLSHLKDFIDYHWKFLHDHGYVETPIFKRRITDKHIQAPKPATVFNYIMQAVEGEISIPVLGELQERLVKYKTKPVLYTYDSILFDYCFDDGDIMPSLRQIMSLDGKFPTKVYVGPNYHHMELVS